MDLDWYSLLIYIETGKDVVVVQPCLIRSCYTVLTVLLKCGLVGDGPTIKGDGDVLS